MSQFEIIEKLEKPIQLEMYMTLLVELGGSIQVRRNQFSQYMIPRIADQLNEEIRQSEYVKEKIRQILIEE